jgi:hypothetical protein
VYFAASLKEWSGQVELGAKLLLFLLCRVLQLYGEIKRSALHDLCDYFIAAGFSPSVFVGDHQVSGPTFGLQCAGCEWKRGRRQFQLHVLEAHLRAEDCGVRRGVRYR